MIKYEWPSDMMVKAASDVLEGFKTNPEGRKFFETYLEKAKGKLKAVERSLGFLAGKGLIDEEGFAPALSDARRLVEECCAKGWVGFNRQGSGCFGATVNLEVTLRSMSNSLASHMIWENPEEKVGA